MLRKENLEHSLNWNEHVLWTCFGGVQKQEGLNKTLPAGRFQSLEPSAITFLVFCPSEIWWWKPWLFWPKRWKVSAEPMCMNMYWGEWDLEEGKEAWGLLWYLKDLFKVCSSNPIPHAQECVKNRCYMPAEIANYL